MLRIWGNNMIGISILKIFSFLYCNVNTFSLCKLGLSFSQHNYFFMGEFYCAWKSTNRSKILGGSTSSLKKQNETSCPHYLWYILFLFVFFPIKKLLFLRPTVFFVQRSSTPLQRLGKRSMTNPEFSRELSKTWIQVVQSSGIKFGYQSNSPI